MTELTPHRPQATNTAASITSGACADPFAPLRGRMLVQAGPEWAERVRAAVPSRHSGLLISGRTASRKAGLLSRDGFEGTLLADPGLYTARHATADEPFLTESQGSIFSALEDSPLSILRDELETQLARGASFALSPTGYIDQEDTGSLQAAARMITELNDSRMIFVVPLSVAWLAEDRIDRTIEILGNVPGIKALVLGGQMDPLRSRSVASLCRLLAEIPDTALLRTDIAAVGALAHNALFTAFGAISSHRHLVPPAQKAARGKFTGGPTSPHVLYPELMSFYLGTTIANRHADGSAPDCYCAVCEGQPLDRFTTKAGGLERVAVAHNIAIMSAWHQALSSAPDQPDPRESWRRQCATAADKTVQLNTALRLTTRKAFPSCPQLAQWAAITEDAYGSPLASPVVTRR